MDNSVRSILITWLLKNVDNTKDPRVHGKGLIGDKSGE